MGMEKGSPLAKTCTKPEGRASPAEKLGSRDAQEEEPATHLAPIPTPLPTQLAKLRRELGRFDRGLGRFCFGRNRQCPMAKAGLCQPA